jgi:hypothetical protein
MQNLIVAYHLVCAANREMRAEYRRKLVATEGQLSSVVRTRLDGVKRARDLITDSASQIAGLTGQFAEMEDLSR